MNPEISRRPPEPEKTPKEKSEVGLPERIISEPSNSKKETLEQPLPPDLSARTREAFADIGLGEAPAKTEVSLEEVRELLDIKEAQEKTLSLKDKVNQLIKHGSELRDSLAELPDWEKDSENFQTLAWEINAAERVMTEEGLDIAKERFLQDLDADSERIKQELEKFAGVDLPISPDKLASVRLQALQETRQEIDQAIQKEPLNEDFRRLSILLENKLQDFASHQGEQILAIPENKRTADQDNLLAELKTAGLLVEHQPKPIAELAPTETQRLAKELEHSAKLIQTESSGKDLDDPRLKELRLEFVDIAQDYIKNRLETNILLPADQLVKEIKEKSGIFYPFGADGVDDIRENMIRQESIYQQMLMRDQRRVVEEKREKARQLEADNSANQTQEKAPVAPTQPTSELTPEEQAWFAKGEAKDAEILAEEAETQAEVAQFEAEEIKNAEAETVVDLGIGKQQLDYLRKEYNQLESLLNQADRLRSKTNPTIREKQTISRADAVKRDLAGATWKHFVDPKQKGFFANLFGTRKNARRQALQAIQAAIKTGKKAF